MTMALDYLAEKIRAGALVASATLGTGMASVTEAIPTDVGKIASAVGIALSIVLIYVHLSRERRDRKKSALELELLRRQLEDG